MPKAVLLSVKPKYCELISSGKKTIEVRKTKPKLESPFKCYIYCTKSNDRLIKGDISTTIDYIAKNSGKIIGEFVCDSIDTYDDDTVFSFSNENYCSWNDFNLNRACIHPQDFEDYANGKWLYGWHISDLKIYDKPKELGNFWKADKCPYATESGCTYKYHCFRTGQTQRCGETLTRPPQSWCYVEEV